MKKNSGNTASFMKRNILLTSSNCSIKSSVCSIKSSFMSRSRMGYKGSFLEPNETIEDIEENA